MRVVCDKCDGEGCSSCYHLGYNEFDITMDDILVAQALRKGEIAGLVPHLVDVETGQLWLMKSYAQLLEEGKKCITEKNQL